MADDPEIRDLAIADDATQDSDLIPTSDKLVNPTIDPMTCLTPRQRAFVEHYAITLNATRSAVKAGYSEDSAYSIGSENLYKPEIKRALDHVLGRGHMVKSEIVARLERMARGDIGAFMTDGVPDLTTDQARDNLGLIQQIDVDVSHGTRSDGKGNGSQDWETIKTRLKLYSAKDALETLARIHKLIDSPTVDIDINLGDEGKLDELIKLISGRDVIDVSPSQDATPAE